MTKKGPRGPLPIYQQIVNDIKEDVLAGRLKPGQLLPAEAELVEKYDTSRGPVRQALAILRDEGVIYTIRTEGSYVGPPDVPKIRPPWPFERVAAGIVEGIKKGGYEPDEVLPSEEEMKEEYGVAKNTVRAAMKLLREQGWVYTVPAIGTFVAARENWPDEPK